MAVNAGPSEDTMKVHSKHGKEEKWEGSTDQLRYMMYGDTGLIINFTAYIMNWKLWSWWRQEGQGTWEICVKLWNKKLAESSYSINQKVIED